MIDLHCHLLPGVDDGAVNMEASLRMANEAVKDGVKYALLTPHHMNGVYVNHKESVIKKTYTFQKAINQHRIPLKVFPGQEVRINGDLLSAIDNDDILYADESRHYLMLEFPDDDVPAYTSNMIYQIMQRGITPVIVHPERNIKIMKTSNILYDILSKGCLSQVTAGSYVGIFGKKVKKFSEHLVKAEQVYVFASDAHDLPKRKYEMTNAFKKLRNHFGVGRVSQFNENAKRIINGDNVPLNNFSEVKMHEFRLF